MKPPDDLAAALLFAVEPTDRALAGWVPAEKDPGHPRQWAQWTLRAYAGWPMQEAPGAWSRRRSRG